jgi:branched-chain amino acid transport system substrate-binding protein
MSPIHGGESRFSPARAGSTHAAWYACTGPVGGGHVATLAIAPWHASAANDWYVSPWGVMTATSIKEAVATGYPREKMFGTWWSGAEPDLKDIGAAAKGYNAVMMQHGAEPQSDVVKEILAKVHNKGQGTGPKAEVGEVLYMRGVVGAMLAVEGVRQAQEKYGKGKWVSPEQARWGYENLNLTQAKLDALGFKGVMRPVSTSCADHMGSAWARVHTWDGSKFVWASDWLQADEQIIKPLVKASAEKYAGEKKLTRRTPADCQS